MPSPMRWLALALVSICLILAQAVRYQTAKLDSIKDEAREHRAEVEKLETRLQALRVEIGVRNVLDAHNINVPRHQQKEIARSILEVSGHYDLPPELILAVIFTESRFDVYAESPKGAVGLMQLMPATALAVAEELELDWKGRKLLTDPQINILLGTSYLRHLLQIYADQGLDYALAAYNVGPTRLEELLRERGRPPVRYARMVRQVTADLVKLYF